MRYLNYIVVGLLVVLLCSCSGDDEAVTVNDVGFWIGEYEIQRIGGEPVSCDVFFLLPETIVIDGDGFRIDTPCEDGGTIIDGTYDFTDGLFELFISGIIQDPIDLPEFEMQIFQEENGNIRIYRCVYQSGNCTLREGIRIR